MQRLFSTFADGWPGGGLLIQRFLVGATLLYFEVMCLAATPARAVSVKQSIAALGGLLLIAGLWTPLAGVLVMSLETWIAVSMHGNSGISMILAVFGLTLAMIGPGAWSVDAWLFGRKRITYSGPQ